MNSQEQTDIFELINISAPMNRLKINFSETEAGQIRVYVRLGILMDTIDLNNKATVTNHIKTSAEDQLNEYYDKVTRLIKDIKKSLPEDASPKDIKERFLRLYGHRFHN